MIVEGIRHTSAAEERGLDMMDASSVTPLARSDDTGGQYALFEVRDAAWRPSSPNLAPSARTPITAPWARSLLPTASRWWDRRFSSTPIRCRVLSFR
jgi:hypothetical protein